MRGQGVFLHTHRHYRLAADHVASHLQRYPGDPVAALLISAFDLAYDVGYRAQGHRVVEAQYAVGGEDSWVCASWLAATRAEQGRIDEAFELSEYASVASTG